MGHPLSQTLFTSIHLDRLLWPVPASLKEAQFDQRKTNGSPKPSSTAVGEESGNGGNQILTSLVLRAYCLALIKACDFIHGVVSYEYYFEVSQRSGIPRRALIPYNRKRTSLRSSIIATCSLMSTRKKSKLSSAKQLPGLRKTSLASVMNLGQPCWID